MNREERLAELEAAEHLEGLHTEPRMEDTWVCPRCLLVLDHVSRGISMDLWECARCGYLKVTEYDKG